MTGAAAMTAFTPAAEARLHDYLTQVRQALYAHPDVSPDDVEADVREHVATEFAGLARPVTLSELETVLARLGPPTQWANAGAASQAGRRAEPFDWRGFVGGVRRRVLGVPATLWKGPEDWRLAYLTFGLTLLTVPTAGLSLIVAYFLGRAAVELAKEKGEPLGARRWLVYPVLVAVSLPLLLALAIGPAVAAGKVAAEARWHAARLEHAGWVDHQRKPLPPADRATYERVLTVSRLMPGPPDVQEVLCVVFAGVGGLAAGWTAYGLLFWAFPRWPAVAFYPLLDGYDGRHGGRLATTAGAVLLVWGGLAYRLWDSAKGM